MCSSTYRKQFCLLLAVVNQPEGFHPHCRECHGPVVEHPGHTRLQWELSAPACSQFSLLLTFLPMKPAVFSPILQLLFPFPGEEPDLAVHSPTQGAWRHLTSCTLASKAASLLRNKLTWDHRHPETSGEVWFTWSRAKSKIFTALNVQPVKQFGQLAAQAYKEIIGLTAAIVSSAGSQS